MMNWLRSKGLPALLDWLRLAVITTGAVFGVYVAFGLILDQIQRLNQTYIMGTVGEIGIIITGFVGTVVHELSHYILCLLFGHKVYEVVWFRPIEALQDGILGYVNHGYDPNNLYQQAGNFFIGIAPMLIGPVILMLIFRLCFKKGYTKFTQTITDNMVFVETNMALGSVFKVFGRQLACLIKIIFKKENIKNIGFWIFLFCAYSISTHMSISYMDLQGAISGFWVIFGIFLVLSAVVLLLGIKLRRFMPKVIKYNIWVASLLSVGMCFSLITLAFSGIIYLVF